MDRNPLRHTTLFWLAWAAAGLAAALLAVRLWPTLLQADSATPPGSPAAATATTPVAGLRPAVLAVDAPPAAEATETSVPRVTTYAPAVRRSAPAVVNIFAERKVTERVPPSELEQLLLGTLPPRYRQRVQQGLGSGVIVDAQGHIVTNNHVIAGADKIQVQLADGRNGEAQVVGRDPYTDLAVLRVKLANLPVMTLGRSDRLQVGDVVLAIGSPLGLAQTVTHGIISATGRADLGVTTFENFIQTDAAINEGNSGGALVDVNGALIGINTAVLGKNRGAEGIGLAIPVDLVRGVMRELLAKGRVVRGWIGIIPVDAEPARAAQLGYPAGSVVVDDLYLNSPALRAGLDVNDRVVAVNGKPVRNAQDATAQIALNVPGSTVKLSVQRGTQRVDVDLKVIEMPTPR